jgi:hypothetical protein
MNGPPGLYFFRDNSCDFLAKNKLTLLKLYLLEHQLSSRSHLYIPVHFIGIGLYYRALRAINGR